MDLVPDAVWYVGAAWLGGGIILALLGGSSVINRVETGKEPKSATYRMTSIVLYPVILLQALILASWELLMRGGAR
jgi:hypothetical protein